MADVLVVDDEKSIRLTASAFLQDAGHTTYEAASIPEAERILEEQSIDVAVVDLLLGTESGLVVARQIREQQPNAQIIMATGKPDIASAREAIRLRFFDYLTKPVPKELILDIVAGAFAEKCRRDRYDRMQAEGQEYL
ncbi:MAG: response regulator [Kiritimatiellia bacterium]|jgi:DNA-binding NtrC family response regulator|nr:response regulator [Kiritimatiellia bacterium]MDP6810829.1 response regulator [Kiritimatiellia bacterium]MDP7024171.1 response regulator [Kiritimatiellia bacterium]